MSQATLPTELTRPGTVLGTAAYMSPDQARGYKVDRRANIWAFGVILHEMLTGSMLFAGEVRIARKDGSSSFLGSAEGGHRPTWAPDASAVYDVDFTGRLQRTAIAIADGSLTIGQTTTITDGVEASLNRVYALDPSQDRILVQRPVAGQSSNRLE